MKQGKHGMRYASTLMGPYGIYLGSGLWGGSASTLEEAIEMAREQDAEYVVAHGKLNKEGYVVWHKEQEGVKA